MSIFNLFQEKKEIQLLNESCFFIPSVDKKKVKDPNGTQKTQTTSKALKSRI